MPQPEVHHSTFVLERSYAQTPERVFAAFADPEKKARWFAEGREPGSSHYTQDFRVGGFERRSSTLGPDTPFPGASLVNDTCYQDIVPNQRIVLAYTMSLADHRISASLATFEFVPEAGGTRLVFTEQAAFLPGADGPEIRKKGWETLLDALGKVVSA